MSNNKNKWGVSIRYNRHRSIGSFFKRHKNKKYFLQNMKRFINSKRERRIIKNKHV